MGKIFDALEKFSKERGAAVSDRIKDSDYKTLMQFDDATGRIDIENPKIAKDPRVIKRLKTYRLINDDGTLTPAGRAKYEEMARKEKIWDGQVPRNTIRADLDYGFSEALTTFGRIGIKVWIYTGESLAEDKPQAEPTDVYVSQ